MDFFTSSEQEKNDWAQELLQTRGLAFLALIALGMALSYGLGYLKAKQHQHKAQASLLFQSFIQKNKASAYQALLKNHKHSPYLFFARQFEAKKAIEKGDMHKAQAIIQASISPRTLSPILKNTAKLRLARIDLSLKQPKEALNVLASIQDKEYNLIVLFLKARAYEALKDEKAALNLYRKITQGEKPSPYDFLVTIAQSRVSALRHSAIIEKIPPYSINS
jgi:predicted negative regulator of RcsB-dependent stress response